jgi:chitinase
MKIKVNLKHLFITAAVTLIAACNGGAQSSGGGGGSSTPETTTVTVPSSIQVRTPTSAQTNLISSTSIVSSTELSGQIVKNVQALSNSSCIQLVTQPNGQTFTTSFNSNQWWSTATVTFALTNTCMGAQSFTANIAFKNAVINGNAVPTSGWNIQQNGNPYMSVTGTANSNPQLAISTPACNGDWCSWAQLAPGASVTFIANLGYNGQINSFNVGSVTINGSPTPTPAPQTTGSLNLNLAATAQTTQACASASANCNFQVNVISPAGVNVESATINANQANTSNYVINNLLPGQYTIQVVPTSVPSLQSGAINYTQTPANTVAVVAGSTTATTTVNFSYTANAVNSVTVNLAGLPSGFNGNQVIGRIIDSNKVQIATMTFTSAQLSQTITSSSFVTGQQYILQVQGLGDPKTGVYYAPIQTAPFTVVSGNNAVTTSSYQLVTSNLYTININVPAAVTGQTISYGADPANDTTDISYISFATDTLTNGTYTFPAQLLTTMTPSTVAGYSTSMAPQNTVTSVSKNANFSVVNTVVTSTLQFFVDSSGTTPLTTVALNSVSNQTTQQIVFIENMGTQSATVPSSASFNSTINGLSVSASTCGTTLASGALCSLTLTYTPTATGSGNTVMSFGAELPITTNSANQGTPIMIEYYCGFSGQFCGQSTNNDVNPATKLVVLAFANINTDGSITADISSNWPTTLIPTWQTGDGHVILSIGGQNAWWSSVYNNSQSISNFVNSVLEILIQYNIDGVDLDIENGSATPQQIADSINLLRVAMNNSNSLKLNQGKGIITVAPQNVNVMQNQSIIGANVNSGVANTNFFVNVFNGSINSLTYAMQQDYNNWYYGLSTPNQTTMLEASYFGWLNINNNWGSPLPGYIGVPVSKLIIGVPASAQAGSINLPTVQGVTDAVPAINNIINPAKMAGIMMWDSHWDQVNNCAMSKAASSVLNIPGGQTCPS